MQIKRLLGDREV